MKIDVAWGGSFFSKTWTNKTIEWEQLMERCSRTKRTAETVLEYQAMNTDQKTAAKDVGGFVGAHLSGARRLNENVVFRQLITLDIDYPSASPFWESFVQAFPGIEAFMYTTHGHTPEKPRMRLLMPMNRQIDREEYTAIGAKVAQLIGLEFFRDLSTFDNNRLMFWPSTPVDGEFYTRHQKGTWIEPDYILGLYKDWRDIAEYPIPKEVRRDIEGKIKKLGEPTEKPTFIGSFCRLFNCYDAIERFLSDEYVYHQEDRYSYVHGSGKGGLVIYQGGKFCYSNHGTDKMSGKAANAFDLVRIVRFSDLDREVEKNTRVDALPSYKRMRELVLQMPEVKVEMAEHTFLNAPEIGFSAVKPLQVGEAGKLEEKTPEGVSTPNLDWVAGIDVNNDKAGTWMNTSNNFFLVLQNDEKLRGRIGFNMLNKRIEPRGVFDWDRGELEKDMKQQKPFIRNYIAKQWKISHRELFEDAYLMNARENRFHPIREHLEKLVWDRLPRLDNFFIDFLGCPDTELTREITKCFLVGAALRVRFAGAKHDNMLVFVGEPDSGKSEMVKILCFNNPEWFAEIAADFNRVKDMYDAISGKWFIEFGEMVGFADSSNGKIKQFVSQQFDTYRGAYKEDTYDKARSCVLVGTTNKYSFLKDLTGDRRFWTLKVADRESPLRKKQWQELTPEYVNQVWAEAWYRMLDGESNVLDRDLNRELVKVQSEFKAYHPDYFEIEDFLNMDLPVSWPEKTPEERISWFKNRPEDEPGIIKRVSVSIPELWREALGNPAKISQRDKRELEELSLILRSMGFVQNRSERINWYGKQRIFDRK